MNKVCQYKMKILFICNFLYQVFGYYMFICQAFKCGKSLKFYLFLVISLYLIVPHITAQEAVDVKQFEQKFYDVIYLNKNSIYTESTSDLDVNSILKNANFIAPNTSLHYIDVNSNYVWFKFKLINTKPDNEVVSFVNPKVDSSFLYLLVNDSIPELLIKKKGVEVFNDKLVSGEERSYLLKLKGNNGILGKQGISVYTEKSYKRLAYQQSEKIFNVIIINSFFIGAIFILFLYHLFLYLQSRKKIYIPYFLYILMLAIYFFVKHPLFMMYYATDEVLASVFFAFNILIQPFIYIFYAQFTRLFWTTRLKFQTIDKLLSAVILCSIALALAYLFLIYFNHPLLLRLHDLYRIALIAISIFILVYFAKYYSKESSYYLFGAGCYLIFSFLAFADAKFDITDYRNIFMQIGAILEILFFAFGLGFRIKKTELEKLEAQEKLVNQYVENEKLQRSLEIELKKELSISQKENEMMELESRLLRSRMNPHFLFNSMNALKSNIQNIQTAKASNYLDQLSQLLRRVLEYSGLKKISLTKELEVLENYLSLEKQRVSGFLNYEIDIGKSIETDMLEIPPMLLQPFVENSIWHGIRHLENRKGFIKIFVREETNAVLITIEDNGVGRERARQINLSNKVKPKSIATELTKERLELLRKHDDLDIVIKIIDKKNNQGTIVIIEINDLI